MGGRRRSFYLGVSLAGFCALVFFSTLQFGFVTGDDASHVTQNPVLRGSLRDLWLAPFQVPGLYMPTTYTVWWAAARASLETTGRLHPTWFHALNWLLHSVNVGLAFLCFRRAGLAACGAALAALVFGLHPIQVEAVAWVTALKDVLTGTFVLLTILLSFEEKWKSATLTFALALLAKPVGAVTPLIVGLFLWVGGRFTKEKTVWLSGWLVASGAVLLWTKSLQPGPTFSWLERGRIAIDALTASAAKTVVPVGLTLNYGRSPASVLAHSSWIALAALFVAGALLWRWRSKTWPVAAAALFLVPWLPVSGVVSFFHQMYSTTADRFLYLSLLGPALALGHILERKKIAGGLVALVLTGLTLKQIPYWRSDATLYGRMAAVSPSADNLYRYAMALIESGRQPEAITPLRDATQLAPNDPRYANNLALVLAEEGKLEEAEAELRKALEFIPDSPTLKANLDVLERRRAATSSPLRGGRGGG